MDPCFCAYFFFLFSVAVLSVEILLFRMPFLPKRGFLNPTSYPRASISVEEEPVDKQALNFQIQSKGLLESWILHLSCLLLFVFSSTSICYLH